MVLELGDMCAVKCEQTNMVCDVEFKTKVGLDSVTFSRIIARNGSVVAMISGNAEVRCGWRATGALYGSGPKFGNIYYLRCQGIVTHAGSFLGMRIASYYSSLPCAAGSFEILLVILSYTIPISSFINTTHPCPYRSLIK